MDGFAARLRIAIERKGLQQKVLASKLSLSPARLSNYVNGHSEPSLDILALMCEVLDVSADFMIGRTDAIEGIKSNAFSITPTSVPRDPLAGLTAEQRIAIDATLKAYHELNAASKEA